MAIRNGRERALMLTLVVLSAVLAIFARGYFSGDNLTDLLMANAPVLIIALGATLVIAAGEIDISVGSIFAAVSVIAGLASKAGVPSGALILIAVLAGAACGALNGALVAFLRVPSIVVTLATMAGVRAALRWATQGAWVQDLPAGFQWLGMSPRTYPVAMGGAAALLLVSIAWGARHLAAGRSVYATGSNVVAARLTGLDTARVTFWVFTLAGALTGTAALLNAARFDQIPGNAGLGLEMKVIASVVVGGAAITGGRAAFTGTLLGVVLLSAIGPALTFLGVSAYWERALQGAIILAAVAIDAAPRRSVGVRRAPLSLDGARASQA